MEKQQNVQPNVINHFIGQTRVCKQVQIALECYWKKQMPLPHTLLTGFAGGGKTTLAETMAKETGATFIQRLGHQLKTSGEVTGLLMGLSEESVIFIDEIHTMPRDCQTQLFPALSEGRLIDTRGPFTNEALICDLPPFTLLAATTDEHRLLKPLRSRFKMTLRFDHYAPDELVQILRSRCSSFGGNVDTEALTAIAERSLGVPRNALRLFESTWRLVNARSTTSDEPQITAQSVLDAAELEGLDSLGLSTQQQRYLALLRDEGTLKPHDLAQRLDLEPSDVQKLVEPDLSYLGLIRKSFHGRELTRDGLRHASRAATLELAHA